jgi:hypothetical protein
VADNTENFNQKEIAVAINNAVVMAKSPKRLGEISSKRLAQLYEYAVALFDPLKEEVVAGLDVSDGSAVVRLEPEEAALICLLGSMFFHTKYVMKSDKLPVFKEVRALLGNE